MLAEGEAADTVTDQLLAVFLLWVRVQRILGAGVAVMLLWGVQRQRGLVPAWGGKRDTRAFNLQPVEASAADKDVCGPQCSVKEEWGEWWEEEPQEGLLNSEPVKHSLSQVSQHDTNYWQSLSGETCSSVL